MSVLLAATIFVAQAMATTEEGAAGSRLFARHCAPCHGPNGEGGRGPTLALPKLQQAPDLAALLRLIRRGIEGTGMPSSRLSPEDVRLVALWVQQLGQRPAEPMPGDVERGRGVYAKKGACGTCHTIRGYGGALGPDLTEIGLLRGAGYLRQSLVEPAADVPKGFGLYQRDANISLNFLQVSVVTKDGRRLTGVRVNEDAFSIQIRDTGNRIHSLLKSELRELHKDWGQSPMPAYGDVLSKDEIDDVVAFLMAQRGRE